MRRILVLALAGPLLVGCGPASENAPASGEAVALQSELPAPSPGPYRIEVGPAGGAGPWSLVAARDGGNQLDVQFNNGGLPEVAADLTFADQDRRRIEIVSTARGEVSRIEVERRAGALVATSSTTAALSQSGVKPDDFPWDGSPFPHAYDPASLQAVSGCSAGRETGTLWRATPAADASVEWEACVTDDGIALPSPFHLMGADAPVTLRIVRGPIDPALFDPANALRLVEPVSP